MKIIVSQTELSLALKEIAKVVTKRPSHPDLAFVKISPVSAGAIKIQGFNLKTVSDLAVNLNQAYLEGFTDGNIYVDLFTFIDAISGIEKSEPVVITSEGESLSIGDNHGVYSQIPYQSSSESLDDINLFPLAEKNRKSFHVDSKVFSQALDSTSFAASRDDVKGVITGVNLQVKGNKVSVVATNGHIMPLIHIDDVVDSEESEFNFTVPWKVCQEVSKLLGKKNVAPLTKIHTFENGFEVEFSIGNVTFDYRSAQVPGNYPNYPQLFPSSYNFTSTVNMAELVPALKAASKVADPHNNVVKLSFSDGSLEVSASRNKDEGEGQVKFSRRIAASSSKEFIIAFNVRYLLDGLKVMPNSGKAVTLQANAPTTPATFLPGENPKGIDFIYLVMPVQIRS